MSISCHKTTSDMKKKKKKKKGKVKYACLLVFVAANKCMFKYGLRFSFLLNWLLFWCNSFDIKTTTTHCYSVMWIFVRPVWYSVCEKT